MAAIHDLLAQVQDQALRERIEKEIEKMSKTKKFGLVFEEHLPECTPLYDVKIKKGSIVAKKAGYINDIYEVVDIREKTATCVNKITQEAEAIDLESLIAVAQFGEPIYPYLKLIDSVSNAPDSDLWHTLIEADNFHALQLLEYLYAGKVDCIYIDPPYNTGAKDWKYNNDYVDGTDVYRHSKWLTFMERRLKLAKQLLNPESSVLIVTIDEKEYLRLGMLLEQMFPEARIQMISTIINPTGTKRADEFSRTNEFIYFVRIGQCSIEQVAKVKTVASNVEVHWEPLRRHTASNIRDAQHPNQFFPLFIDVNTNDIVEIGENLPFGTDISTVESKENCETVWPIRDNGSEMMWGLKRETFIKRLESGYVKIGRHTPNKPQKYSVSYLASGTIEDIETGKAVITGYDKHGAVKAYYKDGKKAIPTTQWANSSHDAKVYGTLLLQQILPDRQFPFPKSLYAVRDCLNLFIANKPDALVVDFFAGSGTTLHAVNLLNANDGGKRRCICVTNNEVSDAEAKELMEKGLKPGDDEWEKLGIARYVTWPRTVSSITGKDSVGNAISGNYFESEMQIGAGLKANAAFFKLGFLDKTAVALGRQISELIPVLWMKAGAIGMCPELSPEHKHMAIYPQNKFAVLLDEKHFSEFEEQLRIHPEITTLYIITDSDAGYREMISGYGEKNTYQLYRDYLDNFRINVGR